MTEPERHLIGLPVEAGEHRKPEFELQGNKLVCKCHGRVVLTFDPEALAMHHGERVTWDGDPKP